MKKNPETRNSFRNPTLEQPVGMSKSPVAQAYEHQNL